MAESPLIAVDVLEAFPEGYHPVRLETARGFIDARHYPVAGSREAVIWVGGVGGGFDTPAHGLYPRLARALQDDAVESLRVRFRHPTELDEAVHDVLAGAAFLRERGIERMGLVGHSFGGAVMAQAAVHLAEARALVMLAPQSQGADAVARLGARCPVLLIHGAEDDVLPPACSHGVFNLAPDPKKLAVLPGTRHNLDETADEVEQLTRAWLLSHLRS